jgi:Cu/Ag efflux protein CusF
MKKPVLIAGLGLALAFGAAACKKAEAPAAAAPATQDYAVIGVVQGFQAEGKVIILKHQKIEGLMDAMTMGFELADPAKAKDLKPGDNVHATLTKMDQTYKITAISKP